MEEISSSTAGMPSIPLQIKSVSRTNPTPPKNRREELEVAVGKRISYDFLFHQWIFHLNWYPYYLLIMGTLIFVMFDPY